MWGVFDQKKKIAQIEGKKKKRKNGLFIGQIS
jgi:hypothetical protein